MTPAQIVQFPLSADTGDVALIARDLIRSKRNKISRSMDIQSLRDGVSGERKLFPRRILIVIVSERTFSLLSLNPRHALLCALASHRPPVSNHVIVIIHNIKQFLWSFFLLERSVAEAHLEL